MKKLITLLFVAFLLSTCSMKEKLVAPVPENTAVAQSELDAESDVTADGCKYCYVHNHGGVCVPTSQSVICYTTKLKETFTTTIKSTVCPTVWTSVTSKAHNCKTYAGYVATTDKSGHNYVTSYFACTNIVCGSKCGQVKPQEISPWMAHKTTAANPRYCSDCKINF